MKTKSARIMGVVIALMLVASLVAGIPMTASAGAQAYTSYPYPTSSDMQLANVDVTAIAVSGSTIYAAAIQESGGYVLSLTLTGTGTGYAAAPTVTIAAPTAGVTATATASINATLGIVTGFTITNPGSGYTTAPTVTIGAGTITATATANIVSVPTASWPGQAYRLLKSSDGGKTWSRLTLSPDPASTTALVAGPAIVGIRVSPRDANTVYVALSDGLGVSAGNNIQKSTDGGATWGLLTPLPVTGNILSFDVADTGTGNIVGVGLTAASANNVMVLDESLGALPSWSTAGNAAWTMVKGLAFSPNFKTDHQIVAVAVTAATATPASATIVSSTFGIGAWNGSVGDALIVAAAPAATVPAVVPHATIRFPSDYNSASNRVAFIGLNGSTVDDVYRFTGVPTTGPGTTPSIMTDLNVGGAGTLTSIASLGLSGATGAATLIAGQIRAGAAGPAAVSLSTNSGISWGLSSNQPTGGTITSGAIAIVALAADFATSGTVYAGTVGSAAMAGAGATAGTANDDTAFSVSMDRGVSFQSRSLIDNLATGFGAPATAGSEMYATSSDNAGARTSVWRSKAALATGGSWERILLIGVGVTPGVSNGLTSFSTSPTYSTDKRAFFSTNNAAGTVSIFIVENVNAGATASSPAGVQAGIHRLLTDAPTPGTTVRAVRIVSATEVWITTRNGNLVRTTDAGASWTTIATGATNTSGGASFFGNTIILQDGATPTGLRVSEDLGSTWRAYSLTGPSGQAITTVLGTTTAQVMPTAALTVAATLATGGLPNTSYAFTTDPDFVTNRLAYMASPAGGLWRLTIGATSSGDAIEQIDTSTTRTYVGLAITAGPTDQQPTMYLSNGNTAGAGLFRSINPRSSMSSTGPPAFAQLGNAAGTAGVMLPSTATRLGSVSRKAGNILFSADTMSVLPTVYTYTDQLAIRATVPSVSLGQVNAAGTSVDATWSFGSGIAGATGYSVTYWPTSNPAATTTLASAGSNVFVSTIGGAPLLTGTPYTFSGRVTAPDRSYASVEGTLTTAPGAPAFNPGTPVQGVAPAPGAVVASVTPTLQWNASSAPDTTYVLVVSKNADLSAPIANLTGATAAKTNVFTIPASAGLKDGDTVYWKVAAQIGGQATPFSSVFAFTITVPKPAPTAPPPVTITQAPPAPTPTIIITQPPAPPATTTTVVVTQPQPTTVTFTVPPPPAQPTPAWVWAIIAIGGILLIVVIVLIARTRKV